MDPSLRSSYCYTPALPLSICLNKLSSCCLNLLAYRRNDNQEKQEEIFQKPLPWIGMYVASASLLCSLAMTADFLRGFHNKQLWFPCKFFSLNAASLTLITVVVKLPVDLSSPMWGTVDQLAKLSSNVFMCVAMTNFMPSLGSMDDRDILTNVAALGILVITVLVNVSIEISTSVVDFSLRTENILVLISMLFLYLILSFSSLTVPTIKNLLQSKYSEIHGLQSQMIKQLQNKRKIPTHSSLKSMTKKRWIMVQTGNPQFVIARSVTHTFSSAICLLSALVLAEAAIRQIFSHKKHEKVHSDYKWSTPWILLTQSFGVVAGTIAPTFRWFALAASKCSGKGKQDHVFKVEDYWIERFRKWRERSLNPQVQDRWYKKLIQYIEGYIILNLCICVQLVIVVTSKSVRHLSIIMGKIIYSFWKCCCTYEVDDASANNQKGSKSEETQHEDLSLRRCHVLLEGDKVPEIILNNITCAIDRFIEKGRDQHPKVLKKLLRREFDSKEDLTEFEMDMQYPNRSSLLVVTLTKIAIAVPKINVNKVKKLLEGVKEGLYYATLVDTDLDRKEESVRMKRATDDLWGRIYPGKWPDQQLRKELNKTTCIKDIIETLKCEDKKKVEKDEEEVIMDRISKPLCRKCGQITKDELFEKISKIIAGVLGACLTSIQFVIIKKCLTSDGKEKGEESVINAAFLLGKMEEIMKILELTDGLDEPKPPISVSGSVKRPKISGAEG